MPVERIAGPWDLLAGGLTKGIGVGFDRYDEQKRLEEERRRRDEEAQRQLAQTATMLFQNGDITAQQANAIFEKAKMPFQVQPNAPQKRRELLERKPQTGPIAKVGLPMGGQIAVPMEPKAGGLAGASTEEMLSAGLDPAQVRLQAIRDRHLRGEQITPQEAEALGVKTPTQRALGETTEISPIIAQQAQQFTDRQILEVGGRISPQNMKTVAEQAYQQWRAAWQASKLGALTPEVEQMARAAFGSAVMERLVRQREADVAALNASNKMNTADDATRAFDALTRAMTEKNNQIRTILQASKIPPELQEVIAGGGEVDSGIAAAYRATVNQIKAVRDEIARLDAARMETAAGFMSPAARAALKGTGGGGGGGQDAQQDPVVARTIALITQRKATQARTEASPNWARLTPEQKAAVKAAMGWN